MAVFLASFVRTYIATNKNTIIETKKSISSFYDNLTFAVDDILKLKIF